MFLSRSIMPDASNVLGARPASLRIYEALRGRIERLGPVEEQVKATSIHLVRRSAFAGVHPRRSGLLLVIRSATPIESNRIRKVERVSANRWHNELIIQELAEVDDQLLEWVGAAYELGG
jgi:hypothetical protein